MSNKQTHVTVGTLAGCGLAAYRAREQEPLSMLLEVIGGGVGGKIGGQLPDVFEPASWPGHRQLAHSAAAGAVIWASAYKQLERWENWCRSQALNYQRERNHSALSQIEKFLCMLMELLLHIAAGVLFGLVAGYLSHLALDWRKSGLPILV